jgi:membrane-bound metal-dependent hydrolase YbcI (DUF457 family)
MKVPEHIAASFLLAQLGLQQSYGPGGTALAVAAGCLPDLDGVTLLGGWRVYRVYHRVLGHGLPLTLAGPALLALIGCVGFHLGPFLPLWGWLQAAFLFHLVTDVCFYRWPVQLLWPFQSAGWGLGLVAWNDLVPTLALYGGTVVAVAWPALAVPAAAAGLGLLLTYLAWRTWQPPRAHWAAWLGGGWAHRSAPWMRWLTGDFIT